MLAPAVARKARASARFHVQIRVASVRAPEGFRHGECTIEGIIQRVFRGGDELQPGDAVNFTVHCYVDPEDHPTGPEWLDFAQLKEGSLIEAFLDPAADGQAVEVALWQVRVIPELTDQPRPATWEPESTQSSSPRGGLLKRLRRRLGL